MRAAARRRLEGLVGGQDPLQRLSQIVDRGAERAGEPSLHRRPEDAGGLAGLVLLPVLAAGAERLAGRLLAQAGLGPQEREGPAQQPLLLGVIHIVKAGHPARLKQPRRDDHRPKGGRAN